MERSQSTGLRSSSSSAVVAIECLTGSSKAEEWNGEMPQTGDVVEELRMGGGGGGSGGSGGDPHGPPPSILRAPFKNGRAGLQRLLHSAFKRKDTSVLVRVRRGIDQFTELHSCIVPCDPPPSGAPRRPSYLLRSIKDPNYAVTFADKTEAECMALQGTYVPPKLINLPTPNFADIYDGSPRPPPPPPCSSSSSSRPLISRAGSSRLDSTRVLFLFTFL